MYHRSIEDIRTYATEVWKMSMNGVRLLERDYFLCWCEEGGRDRGGGDLSLAASLGRVWCWVCLQWPR